jgi:hypothetical protein
MSAPHQGRSYGRQPVAKHPPWRQSRYRHLPYGCWITRDGTAVLFDRDYAPLWSRAPGAASPTSMTGSEWVANIVSESWLYTDTDPPWLDPLTRQRCMQVLKDFGVESK